MGLGHYMTDWLHLAIERQRTPGKKGARNGKAGAVDRCCEMAEKGRWNRLKVSAP